MVTNKSKSEGSPSTPPNQRVSGSLQADAQTEVNEDQDNPVSDSIKLYNEYRNTLHGITPVWELPVLDENVKISFPGISS